MDAPLGMGANAFADEAQIPAAPLRLPFNPSLPASAKTPISLLQEACIRRKQTPVYELISTHGQVHEPVFTYKCMVEGIQGQGSGKSKKTAKHLAALAILQEVARRGLSVHWGIPGNSVAEAQAYLVSLLPEKKGVAETPAADEEPGNPVGKLNERCIQLKLPPPEYELEEELGAPHQRSFKVIVRLGKLQTKAEAKTKKAAKRLGAELMLGQIANFTSKQGFDEDDLIEEEKEPGAAYPADLEAQLSGLGSAPSLLPAQSKEEKSQRGLDELLRTDLKAEVASGETLAWLRNVARSEEDPTDPVSFRKLDHLSLNGQVQCLVQLSTVPVAVCHGTGATETDAQHNAAKNALHYLKIMAKNSPNPNNK